MNITIRQRENGKWQAIVSYKDKKGKWHQKPKGGFGKRKDANQWAKEMSFELQKLENSGVLGNEYTLEEVFELCISTKKEYDGHSNTKDSYRAALKFFAPFKDQIVRDIKALDLKKYIDSKRAETGCLYNDYISKLRSVFNFAIKVLRSCDYNPCVLLFKDDSAQDERVKFIDENLYKKILNSTKKERYKLFIRVLYETGMRFNEALGITIQNVFNCLIKIDKQYIPKNKALSDKLKTKNSYRIVPISTGLYADLKKAACDIDGRIFFDVNHTNIEYILKKFKTSPHCFRHTRATILVSSGIDLTIVSQIIGDRIDTVLKTYVSVNKNSMEDAFDLVRSLV